MDPQLLNEIVPLLASVAGGAATEVGRGAAESSVARVRELVRRWRARGSAEPEQQAPPERQEQVRALLLAALDEDPALREELAGLLAPGPKNRTSVTSSSGVVIGGDNHGPITLNGPGAGNFHQHLHRGDGG
ncbi:MULTISPECIES: hypothetical protein [Kitasatospora]|uniref:Uncharacterized protein n=1 Tax=Kitasatospora setae (strain ATCC 33774 / DSM 43861 / JCM 3304 / KCC A-0304 / NBRC 14216 / KM-6054) TaxID=452652 RepID=E4N2K2_KITSK|nr:MULTISPECIES: hypothetical protein [Kitasatospora]BAJ32386.1 hypothetical protein KSE_66270 [Kitasatospora setae KM-6054]